MEDKNIFEKHINHNFERTIPSTNFTEEVMKKVDIAMTTKTVVEPLISLKTWVIISVSIMTLLLSLFIFEVEEKFSDGFQTVYIDTFVFLLTALLIIIMFLFIDQFLNRKLNAHNTTYM